MPTLPAATRVRGRDSGVKRVDAGLDEMPSGGERHRVTSLKVTLLIAVRQQVGLPERDDTGDDGYRTN